MDKIIKYNQYNVISTCRLKQLLKNGECIVYSKESIRLNMSIEQWVKNCVGRTGQVDWHTVCCWSELTEDFVRKHVEEISFNALCMYYKISQDMCRELADYLDWTQMFKKRYLSLNIVREFKDRIDWWRLKHYWNFEEDFWQFI